MRTLVLIDGQNLYHLARIAWAPMPPDRSSPYSWPSYDVEDLAATLVARMPQRTLSEIRFYTGVPAPSVNQFWHYFWTNKCRRLRNQDVHVYTGRVNSAGQEKGVDVSLALDLIQATHEQRYEVAIIMSQDADFGPAVRLAKNIARSQKRHLLFESASRWGLAAFQQGAYRERRGPTLTGLLTTPAGTCATTASRSQPPARRLLRRTFGLSAGSVVLP